MRMHQFIPWPPATFLPAKKPEKPCKPRTVEQNFKAFAMQARSVPPPIDEYEGDNSRNERTDILA